MKFIIYAASYKEDVGGIIVMHKLCHLLNEMGHDACFYPVLRKGMARARRIFANFTCRYPVIGRMTGKGFRLNPRMNTRLLPLMADAQAADVVTIYGETVSGNPLGARNIVRWFLHQPGFHTGEQNFGEGEFHIDFNEFLTGYDAGKNHLSRQRLHVVHYPLDIYNLDGALPQEDRNEIAYCLRKGQLQPGILDVANAVCIDGLTHAEIAAVFKRARLFVSFDAYTAYSSFAALCGAVSVIVPPPGMARQDWYAKEQDRFGIAFGMEEIDWARRTQELVLPHLIARQDESRAAVAGFVEEVGQYFALDRTSRQRPPSQHLAR